jgi:hypothetical protein
MRGFEPFTQHVGLRVDVLDYGFQESCIEAATKLRDCPYIVGGLSSFASQMFEFGNVFVEAISSHFDLQEFLVGRQLFLTVCESAPEVSFKYAPEVFICWQHGWPILCSGGKSFDFFNHSGSLILNILSFYVGQDQGHPFERNFNGLICYDCSNYASCFLLLFILLLPRVSSMTCTI